MNTTAESIKAFAAGLPEGATVSAKELLHLEHFPIILVHILS